MLPSCCRTCNSRFRFTLRCRLPRRCHLHLLFEQTPNVNCSFGLPDYVPMPGPKEATPHPSQGCASRWPYQFGPIFRGRATKTKHSNSKMILSSWLKHFAQEPQQHDEEPQPIAAAERSLLMAGGAGPPDDGGPGRASTANFSLPPALGHHTIEAPWVDDEAGRATTYNSCICSSLRCRVLANGCQDIFH